MTGESSFCQIEPEIRAFRLKKFNIQVQSTIIFAKGAKNGVKKKKFH